MSPPLFEEGAGCDIGIMEGYYGGCCCIKRGGLGCITPAIGTGLLPAPIIE